MENKKQQNQLKLLVQPNKVTSARYDYTEREENILTLIVDAIQKYMTKELPIQKDLFDQPMVVIDTRDVGIKQKFKYLEACHSIMGKPFSFEWQSPVDGKKRKTTAVLITAYHDVKQTPLIELTINAWAIPYLLYWGKGVGGTVYSKVIALTLRGQYSKRLYKLCKQWESNGGFSMPINDFRKMLNLENKYKLNGDLKAQVLEKAKKELKEKADVYFEYSFEKVGGSRSYNQINFTIYGNDKKLSIEKRTDMYHFVYNFIGYAYPIIKGSKAMEITDKLAEDPDTLKKAYYRFKKLNDDFKSGKIGKEDVVKLIKHILKEDFDV